MDEMDSWTYLIREAKAAEKEGKKFKTNSNRYHWIDSVSNDEFSSVITIGRHKNNSTTVAGKPSTLHLESFRIGWHLLRVNGSINYNDLPRGVKVQQFMVRELMSDVLICNDSTNTIQLKYDEEYFKQLNIQNRDLSSVSVDLSSGKMFNIVRDWLLEGYYSENEAEEMLRNAEITKRGSEITITYDTGQKDIAFLIDLGNGKERLFFDSF
ncbi:MAG: hypothetical protein ACJZ5B_05370 [Candidatus Poseidoniaceae archaeon]